MSLTRVADRPHFVYRVYGARGRLLYIGCTSNLALRKRDHRLWSGEWFSKAKRWDIDGPHDYRTARALELAAIHAERPRYNRTGRVANYNPHLARRRSVTA